MSHSNDTGDPPRDWDDDDDREGPAEADLGDDGDEDSGVGRCPSCGSEISELAERCPTCGDWVTPVADGARVRRWLQIAVVGLLVIALLAWAVS